MRMKSLIVGAVVAGVWPVSGSPALAQDSFDENVKLFRKDVRIQKKQIVAANMDLTDEEAQQFWPIYDRYTAELAGLWDTKFALRGEYALNYTTMSMSMPRVTAVEESIMQLRLKYFLVSPKVLPGKATALFFKWIGASVSS